MNQFNYRLLEAFADAQRSITPETVAEATKCVDRAMQEADRKIAAMNTALQTKHQKATMTFRQRLAHWLWPFDKRTQSIHALHEKLKEARDEASKNLERAKSAELLIRGIMAHGKDLAKKHDSEHGSWVGRYFNHWID